MSASPVMVKWGREETRERKPVISIYRRRRPAVHAELTRLRRIWAMKSGAIVIGVGLGLVGGLAIGMYWTAHEAIGPEMVTVFVAAKEIRPGTLLEVPERLFVSKQLPAEAVPISAITDLSQLKSMIAVRTLEAGELCTQGHIGKYEGLDDRTQLAGRRAMTFRVLLTQPNHPEPGSRVDLLAIMPSEDEPSVLLRNLTTLSNCREDQRIVKIEWRL